MTRRTRTFADVSDSDVFSQIAGDHGLTPQVTVSGGSHKVLAQLNQTDLGFMRERARALDAELWMTDTTLNVKPRSDRGSSPVTLTYGKELREFRVIADLALQATSIEVSGWDVSGKSAVKESADDSVVSGELAGGDSGPSLLSSAFGDRKDSIANTVPQTSDEAHARAEALLKRRARRFLVGHGTAETKPRPQGRRDREARGARCALPGRVLRRRDRASVRRREGHAHGLRGRAARFGEAVVSLVEESVSRELSHHARWFGVYPALVTDIADPDGQGRVKVSLPWSPDDTGYEAWARLATMMGGSNRGTWFHPRQGRRGARRLRERRSPAAVRPGWALERQ